MGSNSLCTTRKCECIIQSVLVTTAWQSFPPEVTVKGFKKCCICSVVDGTDDNMLWNVSSECEEDEGTDCEDGDSDSNW